MPLALERVVARLFTQHGAPPKHAPKTAFQWLVWENVAYLVDDARRLAAYRALEESVGVTPEAILGADQGALRAAIEGGGMLAAARTAKLRRCAEIALDDLGGELEAIVKRGGDAARKALRKFPGIGAPGANKVLMLMRRAPVLALDSNGLRVLLRLGYGSESKSYATTYRSVQDALGRDLPTDGAFLVRAHELLRRHGQETCRRTRPSCAQCVLADDCPSRA